MIKAALYDHSNSIQTAAHEVISSWVQQQWNRQVAYTVLHTGLKEANMHQLATEVQQWVEGTAEKPSAALSKGMCFLFEPLHFQILFPVQNYVRKHYPTCIINMACFSNFSQEIVVNFSLFYKM